MDKLIEKLKGQKGNSRCTKCGTPFQCQIREGKSSCWCFWVETDEPQGDPMMLEDPDCMCKNCLTRKKPNDSI
jgi:hypothetical protein